MTNRYPFRSVQTIITEIIRQMLSHFQPFLYLLQYYIVTLKLFTLGKEAIIHARHRYILCPLNINQETVNVMFILDFQIYSCNITYNNIDNTLQFSKLKSIINNNKH